VPPRLCTLKVPKESVSDYKNAETWKLFNVVGIEETSIEPIENDIIKIYPNPTAGELRITNYESRIESIEIFDVLGNCQLSIVNCPLILDISHLPIGTYFVRLQTDKGLITKKVVKN
jgi:hypothetical protein